MRTVLRWCVIVVVVSGVGLLIHRAFFAMRATEPQVTAAVYKKFGPGPRIRCIAQEGNGSRWNCVSWRRWGDDPSCIPVNVDWTGNLHIADEPVICEG
jgi:hypothetical protein